MVGRAGEVVWKLLSFMRSFLLVWHGKAADGLAALALSAGGWRLGGTGEPTRCRSIGRGNGNLRLIFQGLVCMSLALTDDRLRHE
jgi:hypothetical protein